MSANRQLERATRTLALNDRLPRCDAEADDRPGIERHSHGDHCEQPVLSKHVGAGKESCHGEEKQDSVATHLQHKSHAAHRGGQS